MPDGYKGLVLKKNFLSLLLFVSSSNQQLMGWKDDHENWTNLALCNGEDK